ncbi:P-loop containing nucleoside triphosphate hydrolase protein [Irpex rosettiformis]|uniref:P-loop containing nucleoside triphosphate hydrolase protein n=1 Tax=Irpex rosettiformis TaxID=378272 RepID=A0ACB8U0Z9_9APHY|nr:P-loop containing nucleoside triphosphate hydrolase protein [Irpex rosettiformis]
MSRRNCRFFNTPSGCRRSDCRFEHVTASGEGSSPPCEPDASGSTASSPMPNGTCSFYWKTGNCTRGFQCRYKHDVCPELRRQTQTPSTSTSDGASMLTSFLTPAGLARLSGVGSDALFSPNPKARTPSEVHNALKRFLYDDYQFRHALDAYAFLNLINSATSNNSSWNTEDGQLLLSAIAKGNGLKRIHDILTWDKVSARANYDNSVLSFQRGYIALFQASSSSYHRYSLRINTYLKHNSTLYMAFMEHFDSASEKIQQCMENTITVYKMFSDGSPASKIGGAQVFGSLVTVLLQCLTRIKNATAKYPRMRPLVLDLSTWLDTWITGVTADVPTFRDPLTSSPTQTREQICQHLRTKADQLVAIVNREQLRAKPAPQPRTGLRGGSSLEGVLAALHNSYVGPGDLRPEGPRHDNDFMDISDIRTAPTHEELACRIPPFLPANLHGAPHPLPQESIERLLDIQFRLLREELTSSLRISVQHVLGDLAKIDEHTQLSNLLLRGGGKYKGQSDGQEAVLFNLYTNVEFATIKPDWKGISVNMYVDTPPGKARSPEPNKRAAFWEGMSSKRLLSGGLVALIWQTASGAINVNLGTIASSVRDHVASAKSNPDKIGIRVAFFDPNVDLAILRELRRPLSERSDGVKLLVEATVMFASVRPFLEALRVEPTSIPFSRYLVHHPPDTLNRIQVEPPAYAKVPDFTFQLASLFPQEEQVEDLQLCVTDEESIRTAREELRTRSRLDPSQGDAVIDTLTREVALIQGPPGTGKSYTGVELLRVLLANGVGPVLMIAYTNHALDHMLCSVLDANITQKVVRLGSRSADERIQKFSIEAHEALAGKSRLPGAFASNHWDVKAAEKEINRLMKDCLKPNFDTADLMRWIQVEYPEFYEDLMNPPPWIAVLHGFYRESMQRDGGYIKVGKGGREEVVDDSLHTYWLSGEDLVFLTQAHTHPINDVQPVDPVPQSTLAVAPQSNSFSALANLREDDELSDSASLSIVSDESGFDDILDEDVPPEEAWMFVQPEPIPAVEVAEDEDVPEPSLDKEPVEPVEQPPVVPTAEPNSESGTDTVRPSDFRDLREFFSACGYDCLPLIPSGDRTAEILLDDNSVWTMSSAERLRLQTLWSERMVVSLQQSREDEYRKLREQLMTAVEVSKEGKAAARCELLRNVDIIGCTTTGAANLTAILKAILLVEEAGQVLEAHILGSLVPSIQHTILIGDPLQLRPTLNTYALSMDNKIGGQVYRFDQSLMERLSSSGFPMSQIDVQRRMRPSVSDLIRHTLYPRLEDHPLVKDYPHVRGMHHDIFFMTHQHRENGGEDDAASKYNQFEVDIIVDLVMYLLRQGPYSEEGDIVVLCAYLGQLARMRDALSNKVAVVIDERDQRDLADREAENDDVTGPTIEHVKVTRRVRLRTIDNFQGEEAKIVILSLVRNSGGSGDDEDVHGHSNIGRANVGFLRSENRINVALSRAREGLYIFGNAQDFSSRSKMWKDVIVRLDSEGCVGDALPIACQQHPEFVQYISNPGELPHISPDGGCLRQCDSRLSCGHLCPFKCHSDDPRHLTVNCEQMCTKLCPRGHPCSKPCAESCGQCTTPVPNVELPCGHVAKSIPCALLDDLSQVKCSVRTLKPLSTCEHDLEMDCSDDPALFDCLAICGGILPCCGRNCREQCARCQIVNQPANTDAASQRIKRTEHCKHPCQKRLYCEHPCAEMCSQDHTCTTVCRHPCRQVCPHARCRENCSKPCAPCQEPCTWQCPHFECPVPCGSICARLPCDQRCQELLKCGHRCPSICGEDCGVQVCPLCAPPEQQNSVVDFIMQRSLAEIDSDSESLDELLITVPACGHVFTVETLDGHCSMTDYYRRDPKDERWIGLQAPPSGFRKPPTCPTCRAVITCPRYGRVFKRADLDILENNVAFSMSQFVQSILRNVSSFSLDGLEARLRIAGSNASSKAHIPPKGDPKSRQRKQRTLLQRVGQIPLPPTSLDPGSLELHGALPAEVELWREVVKPLLSAYRDATNIASTRSAHTHAWEASFSYLYQKEIQRSLHDPDHAPRNPQEHAMRVASMGVGQPRPIADQRFLVEAFWLTINIRLTLAQLTQAWMAGLCSHEIYPTESRLIWQLYTAFLYRGCYRDAQLALSIAESSGSHRQTVKTHLLILRIELEQFRFNVDGAKRTRTFGEQRTKLAERAKLKSQDAHQRVAAALQEYLHVRRSNQDEQQGWLAENFEHHAKTIFSEWEKLEKSLVSETFYEPLSLREMENIVRGLNFSHTGHFYKCPKGHTFVIDDCGGAMQRSTCPECGEAIGGYNHERIQGNRRALEFERIATAQGAARSPFSWGQLDNDT